MNDWANCRGATLGEMLVGLCLLGIFLALIHPFSHAMLHGVRVLEAASEAEQAARTGVQLIARDLRDAGFGPTGSTWPGIVRAERDAVTILRDLNADGDTDDDNEVVAYRYSAAKRSLLRGLGRAPAQPMLDDVPEGGLSFAYLDGKGRSISVPPEGLDRAARARIHRVDVQLIIEVPHPDPRIEVPIRRAQTASAQLRNAPDP